MFIDIRTFHDIEVSDSLEVGGKEELTKVITQPWRFFHNGKWWLAFGPAVVGAVSQHPARLTKTYTVFRTKARPTKSMKYPIGGVWDVTRPTPEFEGGNSFNAVTGQHTAHMKMSDYLANQQSLDTATELLFNRPKVETLWAVEAVSRAQMATVPNIADMVSMLLREKIERKVNDLRDQGIRVTLVGNPTITVRDGLALDTTEFKATQKIEVKQ